MNGALQGAAIALAVVLIGRALGEPVRMGKGLWTGLAAGALAAAALTAVFRLLDVMRFGHALSQPAFSALTPMLLTYALAQALGAALAAGLIGGVLSGCIGFWAASAARPPTRCCSAGGRRWGWSIAFCSGRFCGWRAKSAAGSPPPSDSWPRFLF